MISFILHRLESGTRPILTPYDGRRQWDSNLRTPACKSPALPLCYGRRLEYHWPLGEKFNQNPWCISGEELGTGITMSACTLYTKGNGK